MKTSLFLIPALAGLLLVSCAESFDYEKERQAIIDVINMETDAYLARDMDACCSTHVQDSLNMRLTAGTDSYLFLQGWREISRHMMSEQTEDDLDPSLNITVEKDNYRMRIYPTSAFVVCDQVWTSSFDGEHIEIHSIQVRFLEKIGGEWKISFVSWIGTSGYELDETEQLID